MMMVKAYRPMRTPYSNYVLALEDILILMFHDRILTNIVYGHGLRVLSYHSSFVEFLLCSQLCVKYRHILTIIALG
jgi:hypothetical protein